MAGGGAAPVVLVDSWYGDAADQRFVGLHSLIAERLGAERARAIRRSPVYGLWRAWAVCVWGRRFPVVLVHFSHRGALPLLLMERLAGRRRILYLETILRRRRHSLGRLAARLTTWLLRRLRAPTTLGAQVMTTWERLPVAAALGVPVRSVVHIAWPLAAFSEAEREIARSVTRSNGRRVFASGRAACDWPTLFAAVRGRGWDLTVICGRADRREVERLAAGSGAHVLCEVEPSRHLRLLCAADVCVLALREEGASSGQVRLSQALEAGVPVVATQVVGLDGYLVPDVTAKAVPVGDAKALGDAVDGLLASLEARRTLVESASACAAHSSRGAYLTAVRDWVLDAAAGQDATPRRLGRGTSSSRLHSEQT